MGLALQLGQPAGRCSEGQAPRLLLRAGLQVPRSAAEHRWFTEAWEEAVVPRWRYSAEQDEHHETGVHQMQLYLGADRRKGSGRALASALCSVTK